MEGSWAVERNELMAFGQNYSLSLSCCLELTMWPANILHAISVFSKMFSVLFRRKRTPSPILSNSSPFNTFFSTKSSKTPSNTFLAKPLILQIGSLSCVLLPVKIITFRYEKKFRYLFLHQELSDFNVHKNHLHSQINSTP